MRVVFFYFLNGLDRFFTVFRGNNLFCRYAQNDEKCNAQYIKDRNISLKNALSGLCELHIQNLFCSCCPFLSPFI